MSWAIISRRRRSRRLVRPWQFGVDPERQAIGPDRPVDRDRAQRRERNAGAPYSRTEFRSKSQAPQCFPSTWLSSRVALSLQALHGAAAKLPSVPIRRTAKVIGTDTVACMQSGIYWGYIGLIEGLVARIRKEFGEDR